MFEKILQKIVEACLSISIAHCQVRGFFKLQHVNIHLKFHVFPYSSRYSCVLDWK